MSALHWREDPPELVLLHGGFENAHVWDLLGMQLARPLLALDLPGCGESGRIERGSYWPPEATGLLSHVIRQLPPRPVALVGLSFGGLLALSLLAAVPDRISQVILLDVLPGAAPEHAKRVVQWLEERPSAWSFEELEGRWKRLYPHRSARFLEQQILASHTGERDALAPDADCRLERWTPIPSFDPLWQTIQGSPVPIALVRAGRSRVVSDSETDRLLSLRPDALVHALPDSGHHIPIHAPQALASIIERWNPD